MDYDFAIYLNPTMANAYMNRGIAKEVLEREGFQQDYEIAARLDPKFEYLLRQQFDPNAYAQQQQQSQQGASQQKGNTKIAQANNQQDNHKKQVDNKQKISQEETKEQRDRRRFKLSLADTRNLPDMSDEEVEDGRIQNKNVIIELQPIFVLSAYDNSSIEYNNYNYYNLAFEELNKFNNYNPNITVTNKETDYFFDTFANYVRYFEEKININNQLDNNFLSRGIFLALTGKYQDAIKDCDQTLKLNQSNILAYYTRANVKMKMAEVVESLNDPTEELTLPIQGMLESSDNGPALEDYKLILKDYGQCLQLNTNFPFAFYNRAYVKCKLKDYESAVEDLDMAIQQEPDFAEAYFNRGLIKIYLDKVEEGASDLSKAGELGIQDAYNVIKRYCN